MVNSTLPSKRKSSFSAVKVGKKKSKSHKFSRMIINWPLNSSTNQQINSSDKNLLNNWSLPDKIVNYYSKKGITRLFDWQVDCLQLPGVYECKSNLVYSAPTSAGKTIVSDILLYKTVLERRKKAIIILPFVSITVEKVQSLKHLLRRLGVRIDSFAGNTNPRGGLKRVDVAVCTIEKANNMVNRLIEQNQLEEIGLIVVDELHMLGDCSRGYVLELLLSKIIFLKKIESSKYEHLQIVGMSATIPNLNIVANWLEAQMYISQFRPVPLKEYVVIEKNIFSLEQTKVGLSMQTLRNIDLTQIPIEADSLHSLIYLAIETIIQGFSCLIFCPTKSSCESLARVVSKNIFDLGKPNKSCSVPKSEQETQFKKQLSEQFDYNRLLALINTLKQTVGGCDRNLELAIRFGCGFHHAGMTMEERSAVEQAFRDGTLKILCCTSTLSAGVNLPARRVMITSPFDYKNQIINIGNYKQMIGRAGRKGIDTLGESFLFCKSKEINQVKTLLNQSLKPVESQLVKEIKNKTGNVEILINDNIIRAILEVIANKTVQRIPDIIKYLKCTFFSNGSPKSDDQSSCDEIVEKVLDSLTKNHFVFIEAVEQLTDEENVASNETDSNRTNKIVITSLGQAIIASGISPSDGSFIFKELERCRENLCILNDLHLVYEATPTYVAAQLPRINWNNYVNLYRKMDPASKKIANLIGIKEYFLLSQISGLSTINDNDEQMIIHRRFYASIALYDLIEEVPMNNVQAKYGLSKGLLQSLQQQASTFAGMLATFCNRLGWSSLELLIENLQPRLCFGVQRDLVDLVKLPCLSSSIARQLYNKGYENVLSLIYCKPIEIETALIAASNSLANIDKSKMNSQELPFIKVYIPNLDKYITIRDLSNMIISEARISVENDIGQQLRFDDSPDTLETDEKQPTVNNQDGPKQSTSSIEPSTSILPLSSKSTISIEPSTSFLPSSSKSTSLIEPSTSILPLSSKSTISIEPSTSFLPSSSKSTSLIEPSTSILPLSSKSTSLIEPSTSILPSSSKSTSLVEPSTSILPLSSKSTISIEPSTSILPSSSKSTSLIEPSTSILPLSSKSTISIEPSTSILPSSSKSTISIEPSTSILPSSSKSKSIEPSTSILPSSSKSTISNEPSTSVLPSPISVVQKTKVSSDIMCSTPNKSNNLSISFDDDLDNFLAEFNPLETIKETVQTQAPNFDLSSKISEVMLEESMNSLSDQCSVSDLKKPEEDKRKSFSLSTMSIDDNLLSLCHSNRSSSTCKPMENIDLFFELFADCSPPKNEFQLPKIYEDEVNIDNCKLISIQNQGECCKFLKNVFKIEKTNCDQHSPVTIGLHITVITNESAVKFSTLIVDKKTKRLSFCEKSNENLQSKLNTTLIISGVYVHCFNEKCVYYINGQQALYYLKNNWMKHLQSTNSEWEKMKCCSQNFKKWRFISYDLKQMLHYLYEAFDFDRTFLNYHIDWFDCKTSLWLLDPESNPFDVDQMKNVRDLTKLAFKYQLDKSEYFHKINRMKNFQQTEPVLKSIVLFNLTHCLLMKLDQKKLYKSYRLIEIPSRICCFLLETNAIYIDVNYLRRLQDFLHGHMDILKTKIYDSIGATINLESPKQIANVLQLHFGKMTNFFDVTTKTSLAKRKKTQQISTTKDSLYKLQEKLGDKSKLPLMIIEYRKLSNAFKNSIRLGYFVRDNHGDKPSPIYCHCIEWTLTGRITMDEPNLINLEKNFNLTFEDKHLSEKRNEPQIQVRRVIVTPDDNFKLVTADYCQLELRILAHFSNDTNLMNVLNEQGTDVFKSIAAKWKQIPYDQVDNDIRQQTKQICYGIIYGMGDKALASELKVNIEQAIEYKKAFFQKFHKLALFIDATIEQCEKHCYVQTISGRRRQLPLIHSAIPSKQLKACRQAVNTKIQGSAADILKIAMVAVQRQIDKQNLNVRFVLQMYDELMYQVHLDDLKTFGKILQQQMENVSLCLKVLLPVKISYGNNWSDLKSLNLE